MRVCRPTLAAKALAALVLTSVFPPPRPASAAITVVDPTNLAKNAQTALNSAKQLTELIKAYQLQVQQYQNMLQNTVAPAAYIWAQAQTSINGLRTAIDQLESLKSQAGGLNNALAQFKDVNYYRSSPCFTSAGCTPAQRAAVESAMRAKRVTQMAVNDSTLRGIDAQQVRLSTDAGELLTIQANAQTAVGQLEALGYANQLAGNASHQLIQIRGLLLAQQSAATAQAQAAADLQAARMAASDQFRSGTFTTPTSTGYSYRTP